VQGSSTTSPVSQGAGVDERDLVERARNDRTAFAELYRRHVTAVYAFASRRSGSREVAEEATSAAFENALRSIGSFEWRPTGVLPWLYRITSNEVANVFRRRAAAEGVRGQRAMRVLAAPTAADDTHDRDLHHLHLALADLPSRYRDVIVMRYLSDLSADEAAEALGCSKPVLAVTLHRALAALRKRLAAVDVEAAR
jgi:RNA polymerase sigma-70 factor (ECF subfamily)